MISTLALLAAPSIAAPALLQADYNDIWARSIGTSTLDDLTSIGADGAGGAYVGGYSFGALAGTSAGGPDAVLRRVDASGLEAWAVQFGSTGSDTVADVAGDGAGRVFAVGSTSGLLGAASLGGSDVFVACLDADGAFLWLEQIGTVGEDAAFSVLPDGAGGCLVAGSTTGDFGGTNQGSEDVFVARVDAAGAVGSVMQLGSAGEDDSPVLAADGAGGYFLSARTDGSLGGTSAGGFDVALARFDSSDSMLWSRQFGSDQNDSRWALAADDAGGVFVCGTARGVLAGPHGGDADRIVGRFDGAGNTLFLDQTGSAESENAFGIAWDAVRGRLYVVGTWTLNFQNEDDAYLSIFTADGTLLQQRNFGEFRRDIAVDVTATGTGGAIVAGFGFSDYGGINQGLTDQFVARFEDAVGTRRCSPAVPNQTGLPGRLRASGSTAASNGNLHLFADQLPPATTGIFLASQTAAVIPMAGGSLGTLCLGGEIGRYVGPNQVQLATAEGTMALLLDLSQTPQPTALVPVLPGQTWHFQAWYRDTTSTPTTNFTDAIAVDFQ